MMSGFSWEKCQCADMTLTTFSNDHEGMAGGIRALKHDLLRMAGVRQPMKFGEGMRLGTVEWERPQTQRREETRSSREMQQKQKPDIRDGSENIPTTYSFFLCRWFVRMIASLHRS